MSSAFLEAQVEAKFQPQVKAGVRTRIAFVCIGNACRSQMAEGWVRHRAVEGIEAVSAGLTPLGYITPETDPYKLPSLDFEYLIYECDAFRRYLEGALVEGI